MQCGIGGRKRRQSSRGEEHFVLLSMNVSIVIETLSRVSDSEHPTPLD
jgi:hypothetical protein